ncbi:hypothetical protein GCM10011492_27620 [Flexivirga endophytica]|uniref:Uncharacterized protein n=1 Tax=Flexivirga endophytica TaxID=1849103 RepID=A0A916WWJ0_9MICO|nr:hypothetical protein [Flexivirga endophytica]GGB35399.1 hypothetical protein GCM10011492_27620 [Flexivirga endophytica]GHB43180.1 hypothetical protein GCM10008112_10000 [Flexivirga endophytica]
MTARTAITPGQRRARVCRSVLFVGSGAPPAARPNSPGSSSIWRTRASAIREGGAAPYLMMMLVFLVTVLVAAFRQIGR